MKVLVVHNAYQSHHVGGEDIIVEQEIAGLEELLGADNIFQYRVSNDDIKISKLARTIWGDGEHARKVATLVRKHAIDIVHVHNFFPLLTPAIFSAAKSAGAKVVHTLHNFRWWCLAGTFYRNNEICERCIHQKWGWPAIIHRCYRNSLVQSGVGSLAFAWYHLKKYQSHIDAYFALSKFAHEKLKNLLPPEKIWLKPNFIPAPLTPISPSEKKGYLYVGRLEPAKGIDILLKVWQQLPAHFELDVIGTGEKLQDKYACSNIRFLGKVPHDQTLTRMARAKYVIHPGLAYETFGLTVVEALAQGTPVIGFERGTRVELINSGQNGFLCQPDKLNQAIMDSFQVPDYAQLCHNAFESAKAYYLPAVMAKQVDYYRQILALS